MTPSMPSGAPTPFAPLPPVAQNQPAVANPILTVPSTPLRPPVGVQEIGNQGGGNYLAMVSGPDWKLFSYKEDANALLALLTAELGISATVIEDGEEASRFEFSASNDPNVGPRVYSIIGTDASGNMFYEVAGDILSRRVKPEFGVDEGEPFKAGDTLKMNLYRAYGFAEFFWSK